MAKSKTCSCCKKSKPVAAFGRNRSAADGLHYYCRLCSRAKHKQWVKANPDRVKAIRATYLKGLYARNETADPYA